MTNKAYYHLPGLFEFYDLYAAFLPIFRKHRDYFYDWCEIGSVMAHLPTGYGAADEQASANILHEKSSTL